MGPEELKYWLWLGALSGISPGRAWMLVSEFGDPYAVWGLGAGQLAALPYMNARSAAMLLGSRAREGLGDALARVLAAGIEVVPLPDGRYPPLVREIPDPPLVLFRRGRAGAGATRRAVAVVGSRRPTPYGLYAARKIASGLVAGGYAVVSGLAMGVDAEAHAQALADGGQTAAFVGCGLDRVYPRQNWRLAAEIEDHGCVFSEFPPGMPPLQQNFPQRNRLISGMSLGVVVVEAGERSGALITAGFAAEQGRDVFAVPGNVDSPQSRGSNALLRDGAILATCAEDVLPQLNRFLEAQGGGVAEGGAGGGLAGGAAGGAGAGAGGGMAARQAGATAAAAVPGARLAGLAAPERAVVRLLRERAPLDMDAIVDGAGLSCADAGAALVSLELSGLVRMASATTYALNG